MAQSEIANDTGRLRQRVWTTNTVAALLGFGMCALFILLPEFVETPTPAGYGFGASVTGVGLFLVPSTIAMLLAGAQTGRLEKRFGSKPPLLAGAAVASILASTVGAGG